MKFDSNEADQQAMHVIELLIESGHYKGFHKEDVIKIIAKDANVLALALTSKPEESVETKEAVESESDAGQEIAFPQGWAKPASDESV
jgi:hypothetical protein